MKTRKLCRDCGRPLRTPTADRCLDCYRDWVAGPPPMVTEPDWVVVERLMRGEPVRATTAEREAAARALAEHGCSASEISRTLRMGGSRTRQVISA